MMMSHINAMKNAAAGNEAASPKSRAATITAYNPNTYSVKVQYQPSGLESGWLPILTPYVGSGWGLQVGPSVGDLVTVTFQEGDQKVGVVIGSLFNTSDKPQAVPSGEFWLQHKSGSLLKFLNNGDVQLTTSRDLLVNAGRDVTVTGARNFSGTFSGYAHMTATSEITLSAPTINLNGTISQTTGLGSGNSTMQGTLTVQGQLKSNTEVVSVTTPLHSHQHTNVTMGLSNTGGPTP